MLDLDPDQQEVDLPNNHVLEVVSNKETHQDKQLKVAAEKNKDLNRKDIPKVILLGFIVFKLDVQTVFYANLHLD